METSRVNQYCPYCKKIVICDYLYYCQYWHINLIIKGFSCLDKHEFIVKTH